MAALLVATTGAGILATACASTDDVGAQGCDAVDLDPQTQECRDHETPAGGAYSVATYLDEDLTPVPRDTATKVEIVEYAADGTQLQQTLADIGG